MAATPAAQSSEAGVEVDPIRCWWKTSVGAVRVGEQFTLTLTCAVLEGADVQVVPDQAPLAPATIQLAPFDVVSGTHPEDQRAGLRRFFQYVYVLRVIGPDVIGKDVPLPPLSLHYRVTSRVSANAALEGRDLSYVLPAQAIRVVSLVPVEGADVRDGADAGFDAIARLAFRANVLSIVSLTLAGLALVTLGATVARVARRARRGSAPTASAVTPATIRRRVSGELAEVARESRAQGWSEPLIERALAASRVAAALALGRTVAQQPGAPAAAAEGRLVVAPRFGRRAPVAVSSPVTAEDLARRLDTEGATSHADRATLDDLRDALAILSSALYAEDAAASRDRLDEAVARAEAAASRITMADGVAARLRGWWPLRADARVG